MTPTLAMAVRTRSAECWALVWDRDYGGAMLFDDRGVGRWVAVAELERMADEVLPSRAASQ